MESAGIESRPWGHYEVLDRAADHLIKRIVVSPGGRLSLQRHRFRREHWYLIAGEALVTRGETEIHLTSGHSIDIPLGVVHRVLNPAKEPLIFIEVQTGSYLGEDDIERLQDDYGRSME